jgi:hypothetical protein
LNYINKKDKLCNVCKAEIGLIDPSVLIPDEEELGVEKLCPVCRVNYIGEDEEICFLCQKERDEKLKNADERWDIIESDDDAVEPGLELEPGLDELVIAGEDELFEDEDLDELSEAYSEPNDFDFDIDEADFEDDDDFDDEDDDDFDEDDEDDDEF